MWLGIINMFSVRSLLFKIYKMIIEHEGNIYETVIKKPIKSGDYYYDFMINKVKQCETLITFDPWSLKMVLIEEENEEV